MIPFRVGKKRLQSLELLPLVLWVLGSCPCAGLGSVGAGRDGFVQLHLQSRCGNLQVAETRPTHTTGLEQLLAWHRDLLIATAGTEHIPTIPAGGGRGRGSRERDREEWGVREKKVLKEKKKE